ncbi:hypothetical protein [Enteroscipio rubneri]|uniref:Uncharacterized protein n=1 Tax=Enteroscipio rubneri TaxID=2070686 RepID=A0A2K2U9H4_9ACTN|nr:hypothetical protein [Enteroscipio rubneri]PNV66986.1 hypothetical protein C2L71_10010 [Enteroscipio rubneri]
MLQHDDDSLSLEGLFAFVDGLAEHPHEAAAGEASESAGDRSAPASKAVDAKAETADSPPAAMEGRPAASEAQSCAADAAAAPAAQAIADAEAVAGSPLDAGEANLRLLEMIARTPLGFSMPSVPQVHELEAAPAPASGAASGPAPEGAAAALSDAATGSFFPYTLEPSARSGPEPAPRSIQTVASAPPEPIAPSFEASEEPASEPAASLAAASLAAASEAGAEPAAHLAAGADKGATPMSPVLDHAPAADRPCSSPPANASEPSVPVQPRAPEAQRPPEASAPPAVAPPVARAFGSAHGRAAEAPATEPALPDRPLAEQADASSQIIGLRGKHAMEGQSARPRRAAASRQASAAAFPAANRRPPAPSPASTAAGRVVPAASAGERKPEALVARVVPRDEDAAAKQPDKHSTIDRQLEMLVQKRLRELRDAGVIADASPRRALEERPPDRHESDAGCPPAAHTAAPTPGATACEACSEIPDRPSASAGDASIHRPTASTSALAPDRPSPSADGGPAELSSIMFDELPSSIAEGMREADELHRRSFALKAGATAVGCALLATLLGFGAFQLSHLDEGSSEGPSDQATQVDSGQRQQQRFGDDPADVPAEEDRDRSGTVVYRYTMGGEGDERSVTETVAFGRDGLCETSSLEMQFADAQAAQAFLADLKQDYGSSLKEGEASGASAFAVVDVSANRLDREQYEDELRVSVEDLAIVRKT